MGVFQQLAKCGQNALLIPDGKSCEEKETSHNAAPAEQLGGASATAQLPVSEKELQTWLAQDLVEPCAGGYRLSATGRAWVRRKLSSADAFQEQHQVRALREIEYERTKRPAIVDEMESPLAWLAKRKDKNGVPMLLPHQFEAGERLRADFHFAGLTARVTANWNPAASTKRTGGGGNDLAALTDNVMAARQRVVRALAAVGPELSGVLVDVCCHLKGLEEAERAEKWPQRSGKVVLQIALTRLARHYGLINEGQGTDAIKRRLQHWGAEDYRPKITSEDDSDKE
ncbi:MAG: DUF6456 domain-containing protein [Alphaproteobacteria bacterium]